MSSFMWSEEQPLPRPSKGSNNSVGNFLDITSKHKVYKSRNDNGYTIVTKLTISIKLSCNLNRREFMSSHIMIYPQCKYRN